MNNVDKDELIYDLKQAVLSLKTDKSLDNYFNAQRDIKFLEEMRCHAIKAFYKGDVCSKEMLLQMVDDWINELKKII